MKFYCLSIILFSITYHHTVLPTAISLIQTLQLHETAVDNYIKAIHPINYGIFLLLAEVPLSEVISTGKQVLKILQKTSLAATDHTTYTSHIQAAESILKNVQLIFRQTQHKFNTLDSQEKHEVLEACKNLLELYSIAVIELERLLIKQKEYFGLDYIPEVYFNKSCQKRITVYIKNILGNIYTQKYTFIDKTFKQTRLKIQNI